MCSSTSTDRCSSSTPRADTGSASSYSVAASPAVATEIDDSLTLHGPDGERLVGFDNAHPVARQKRGGPQDHRHRLRTIGSYDYHDAATLVADFWSAVDAVLREKGVIQ